MDRDLLLVEEIVLVSGLKVSGLGFRNVKRFREGLVFKALRLLYHSTLSLRVIKKREGFGFWVSELRVWG